MPESAGGGPSAAHRVATAAGWGVSIGVVAFAVAFFSLMAGDDGPLWAVVAAVVMLVFGIVFGVLAKGPGRAVRSVVVGLLLMVVAVVFISWMIAIEPVVHGGIPPGPGETMSTPIGWFSPRFWGLFLPAMVWVLVCLIPYAGGAILGWLASTRAAGRRH